MAVCQTQSGTCLSWDFNINKWIINICFTEQMRKMQRILFFKLSKWFWLSIIFSLVYSLKHPPRNSFENRCTWLQLLKFLKGGRSSFPHPWSSQYRTYQNESQFLFLFGLPLNFRKGKINWLTASLLMYVFVMRLCQRSSSVLKASRGRNCLSKTHCFLQHRAIRMKL